jgi:hypothetical protein
MVVRCPVGLSVSGIVIEVRVCGSDSVGIVKAVLWWFQCNRARSRSKGEDIMVVQCPVKHLGIVRCDRSCLLEQWATIHWDGLLTSPLRQSFDGFTRRRLTLASH